MLRSSERVPVGHRGTLEQSGGRSRLLRVLFSVLTSLRGRWECSSLTFHVETSGKGPHPEAGIVGILKSLRFSAGNFS